MKDQWINLLVRILNSEGPIYLNNEVDKIMLEELINALEEQDKVAVLSDEDLGIYEEDWF